MKNLWMFLVWVGLMTVGFAGCQAYQQSKNPREATPVPFDQLQNEVAKHDTAPSSGASEGTGSGRSSVALNRDATTPRGCYEAYRRAIKEKDYEGCWEMLSKSSKDSYESAAGDFRMRVSGTRPIQPQDSDLLGLMGFTRADVDKINGKMLMTASMQRASMRDPDTYSAITRTEFDHESTWGDRAKVYFKGADNGAADRMDVVREGKAWRVDTTKPKD